MYCTHYSSFMLTAASRQVQVLTWSTDHIMYIPLKIMRFNLSTVLALLVLTTRISSYDGEPLSVNCMTVNHRLGHF